MIDATSDTISFPHFRKESICATAKGYELLATERLRKAGEL